jgi:hypothetical protein
MSEVPSNLIPTRITQLPVAPVADENSLMMIVYQGNNYQIRVGDLLSVAGVPTSRAVLAGTGLDGGGQLTSNVTLSIAPGGVGSTELANSGVTPGVYGTSTNIPVLTVDATGRVMAATTIPATISGYVPENRQVIAGTGLTGGGALNTDVTLNANLSNATPLVLDDTGSAGVSTQIARADHQHPAVDLSDQQQINGILPVDQGGTSRSLVPDEGAIIWCGADGLYVGPVGTAGQVLVSNGTGEYTWGSALLVVDQPANVIYAGPASGPNGPTAFRSMVIDDLPVSGASAGTYGSQSVVPVIAINAKGQVTSATNTSINAVTLTTGSISTAPTNGTDIVNKNYADSIATGINFHQACRLATTAALPSCTYNNGTSGVGATLTATANGALSVDSTLVVATNRVLVKNQANTAHNGVYVVTQVGDGSNPFILTRATDFDSAGTGVDQIDAGDFFLITAGTSNANTSWVQQTPLPITVGTTGIVFSQFGAAGVTYTAGTGLTLAGTVFSITNTAVAAASYGSASSVGTFTVNAQGQLTAAADTSIAIASSQITSGTIDSARISGSYTGITGVGTLTVGTWNATTIGVAYGGTGLTSYAAGDLVYASGTTTISKLALGTSGQVLTAGASAPQYVDQSTLSVGSATTAGSVTNSATFNNSGTGDASGTTFNGSAARTVSYNTVGAPSTSGTNATGTWNISITGNAATATSATSATTATNLAGGAASQIPYQTGAGATAFLANGTAGQVLLSNGASAPSWGGVSGGTF